MTVLHTTLVTCIWCVSMTPITHDTGVHIHLAGTQPEFDYVVSYKQPLQPMSLNALQTTVQTVHNLLHVPWHLMCKMLLLQLIMCLFALFCLCEG